MATQPSNVGQDQAAPQGQEQQDPLAEFRQLAQQVNTVGQKYPEAAEGAAQMMKIIQQMMTRVAGNPSRTQPKQAPPMA